MLEAVEERVTPSADPFNLSSLLDANQLFGGSGAVQNSDSGNSESRDDIERGPQGSPPAAAGQAPPDTTGGSNGAPVNGGENASENSQAVRERLVSQGKAHGQIRRFDPEGADAAPTASFSAQAVGDSGGSGGSGGTSELSINDVSQSEGDAGTSPMTFTVTRSGDTSQTTTVDYATGNGLAEAGSDYEATSGTLTFDPGVTSQTISVSIFGDTTVEPNEDFTVLLTNVTNGTIASGSAGIGLGTIVNDDAEPLPTVSVDSVSQSEGDSGTSNFTFTVSLSNASSQPVEVNVFTRDGSASSSQGDYQAKSETLTFAPGETSKTFDVVVNGDTEVEPDETFFVDAFPTLNASGGGTGTGTIASDDAANQPPTLDPISDQFISEGSELSFTVSADDPDSSSLTYSLAAGTPSGASIDATTGEFSWTPTETQGPGVYPITVVVSDDGSPSLTDSDSFQVTVNEVNLPPVLDPIGDQSVVVGETLEFTATATDSDLPANQLTYSLDSRAPVGASINSNTGEFSWTPTSGQVGDTTFSVRVGDGVATVAEEITASVLQAPALGSISGQVFEDINGDGNADTADQNPVSEFVILLDDGTNVRTATTDQNGSYSFTNLDPSLAYTISLQSRFGWTVTKGTTVAFPGPGQNSVIDFLVFENLLVKGKVFIDKNGDGIDNEAAEPGDATQLVGWLVYSDTNGDLQFNPGDEHSVFTDFDGNYTLDLFIGSHEVRIVRDGTGWAETTHKLGREAIGQGLVVFESGQGTIQGATTNFGLVPKVEVVHPIIADFAADHAGRIMMNTDHDNVYHTAIRTTADNEVAQTEDGKVTISAYLTEAVSGVLVFFEVIDPDDPSPYTEDTEPLSKWGIDKDGTVRGIDGVQPGGVPDTNPNDNREFSKSMYDTRNGTRSSLAAYSRMQEALSRRVAATSIRTINGVTVAVAEVELSITERFAGDNYQVRATVIDPGLLPFNSQSGVAGEDGTVPSQDRVERGPATMPQTRNVAGALVQQSAILTAWKRIYYEQDEMYRHGSLLTTQAMAGDPELRVESGGDFEVALQANGGLPINVRLFDSSGASMIVQVTSVTPRKVHPPAGPGGGPVIEDAILTMSAPLPGGFLVRTGNMAFAGIETGNRQADFFIPITDALNTSTQDGTFDDVYTEVVRLANGSTSVPRIDDQFGQLKRYNRFAFAKQWFDNRDTANYFYVVGANTGFIEQKAFGILHFGGIPLKAEFAFGNSSSRANWSFIYVGGIESSTTGGVLAEQRNRSVVAHEIVHQFGGFQGDGNDHQDLELWHGANPPDPDEPRPQDLTLMTTLLDDPGTADETEGRSATQLRLGFTHLYKIRDFEKDGTTKI